MKIRWRQHEMLFAIILFIFLLIDNLRSPAIEHGESIVNGAITFSETNYITSFLLLFAPPLALLLVINGRLLPAVIHHPKRWVFFLATFFICWIILILSNTAYYSTKYNFFVYTGRVTSAQHQKYASRYGFQSATILCIVYFAYFGIREVIIQWLDNLKTNRDFRVMVCNKITFTAFSYMLIGFVAITLSILKADGPAIIYVFILLPSIVVCLINVYIIFPRQSGDRPLHKKLLQLAAAPFVIATLTAILSTIVKNKEVSITIALVLLSTLFLLATPVSWLIYILQRDKIKTLLQLETQLGQTTADLAFLRSQINPHFLFNTLNTLYGTALQENAPGTATGIQRLGDMMRFMLHENHRDTIPLSREIEYLQHYIALQSLRIANSTAVRIETSIDQANCSYSIAPMLLIPFVENAFKHGIRLTKPSYIIAKFYCDQQGVYLDVVNSRHPKNSGPEEEQSGVGLENVKQRLNLIYAEKHSLHIHEDDAAFHVRLFISLR